MEKVVNGSEGYIAKETKRYVHVSRLSHDCSLTRFYSLASILKKRVLSAEKLDEIKTKANVLASFAAAKAEEARDTIERAIEDL
jgi:protein disulfide-isomerase A6